MLTETQILDRIRAARLRIAVKACYSERYNRADERLHRAENLSALMVETERWGAPG